MEFKSVSLMIRFKDAAGVWKRGLAARGANGRVKPGHALIDDKVVSVESWTYDLRYTVDRKTVYKPAGKNAAAADAARSQFELKSAVKAKAKDAGVEVVDVAESGTLKDTAAAYIEEKVKSGFNEAAAQALLVTSEFMRVVKCTRVDQVTKDDIFAYHAWLRKNRCEDRTVSNKHLRLASWLRFGGIDSKQIPPKPRFEESLPDMYSSEQTRALLSAANTYMCMCILLGLKCGLRDQELRHLEFRDVNWQQKTLRVRSKPQWKFKVKTWEQRDIPVPSDVLAAIKQWQNANPKQTLILGTRNRRPNSKMLLALKHVAKHAGLNCKRCTSCMEREECSEFTLHRLRRTYLTTLLRGGIDLRTVQSYAGHRLLEMTMRYLAPQAAPEAQAKVNAIQW